MGGPEEVPNLYIPSRSVSSIQSSTTDKLSLAHRRKFDRSWSSKRRWSQFDASDAASWTPPAPFPDHILNKPLPPLPHERLPHSKADQISKIRRSETSSSNRKSSGQSRRTSVGMLFRTVARVVRARNKVNSNLQQGRVRPANYVDKGTQTYPDEFPNSTKDTVPRPKSPEPDPKALRDYHAGIQHAHAIVAERPATRPKVVNMRSLKSFLQHTSPSAPGTPTPNPSDFHSLSGGTNPITNAQQTSPTGKLETLQEEPHQATLDKTQSQIAYSTPAGASSLASVGTYESKYSEPSPLSMSLPGASVPNTQLSARGISPRPDMQPAKPSEVISASREASRWTVSDTDASTREPEFRRLEPYQPSMRPPTPMPEDDRSAPPALASSSSGEPTRVSLTPPLKGRHAELRRSSPGRASPLRQHMEAGDTHSSKESRVSFAQGISFAPRNSPSYYDHHARAAKQGLPADAFIPPPTPPLEAPPTPPAEGPIFRRPIFDYFSSPEGEAARRMQEDNVHVPDHYQNSPLCPLHPKHRGGQGEYCPIHGTLSQKSTSDEGTRRTSSLPRTTMTGKASDSPRRPMSLDSRRTSSSGSYSPRSAGPSVHHPSTYVGEKHAAGTGAYMLASMAQAVVTPGYDGKGTAPSPFNFNSPTHERGDPKCPIFSDAKMCVYHGRRSGFDGSESDENDEEKHRGRKRDISADSILRWPDLYELAGY